MEIRRLGVSDAEKLVHMVRAFRTDTSNPEVAERFLGNPANYIIAAVENEKVIQQACRLPI